MDKVNPRLVKPVVGSHQHPWDIETAVGELLPSNNKKSPVSQSKRGLKTDSVLLFIPINVPKKVLSIVVCVTHDNQCFASCLVCYFIQDIGHVWHPNKVKTQLIILPISTTTNRVWTHDISSEAHNIVYPIEFCAISFFKTFLGFFPQDDIFPAIIFFEIVLADEAVLLYWFWIRLFLILVTLPTWWCSDKGS